MAYYLYNGKLTSEARNHILENAKYFDKIMRESVAAFGGNLVMCFWTANASDPIGFIEFEEDLNARAWSTYYGSQAGVVGSTIQKLLSTDDLVELKRTLDACREAAERHRKGS